MDPRRHAAVMTWRLATQLSLCGSWSQRTFQEATADALHSESQRASLRLTRDQFPHNWPHVMVTGEGVPWHAAHNTRQL